MKPDEYKIRTVQDFLMVPADKRDALLSDFKEYLYMLDEIKQFNEQMRDITGVKEDAVTTGDSFNWVDDGISGVSKVTVTIKDE